MSDQQNPAAGFYRGCRAIAGSEQYAVNPSNGNEQIAIDVHVPELERTFTTFLHFSGKAAPYAIERLRACGWTGDDLAHLDGIDQNDVDVSIKYEAWEGKTRMKVEIATGGGGRIKLDNPMGEQQKRAFAARMKSVIKGSGGAAPSAARPAARPAPAAAASRGAYDPGPPDGDDLPF